jgi:hypothetical protein
MIGYWSGAAGLVALLWWLWRAARRSSASEQFVSRDWLARRHRLDGQRGA